MAESTPERPAVAGFNQFFVCRACGKAFRDRAAKDPIDVTGEFASVEKRTSHPKYPDDRDLDKIEYINAPIAGGVTVKAVPAAECCAGHAALCDSRHVTIRLTAPGVGIVVGAKHLE